MSKKLMTPKEAMEALGVSSSTLSRMRTRGQIPVGTGYVDITRKGQIIRYKRDWIEKLLSGELDMEAIRGD